jgi:hypothetical protein
VLSGAEIARGTQGSLGFLQLDRTAPLQFDNTMAACLRSFRLMALVAPLQVIALLLRYSASDITYAADDLELVLVETLHYVVDWLLFPVIFYEIARLRGWLDKFPRYISALNWMNLPGMAIAVVVLAVASLLPNGVGDLLRVALQGFVLYWLIATTRLTLEVSWPVSVALMLANWVPSELLSLIVDRFLGVSLMVGG